MQILFSVTESLNELCAWICSIVYQLVAKIYEIFFEIAKVDILTTDEITSIYSRVTMILTIIMTFYITFEMVKYIIEPDKITDKEAGAGKIASKLIIVVVLIAFVPTIFSKAFELQTKILENDLITKIVLGTSQDKVSLTSQGRIFSSNVLNVFYYVEPDVGIVNGVSEDCDGMSCENIVRSNLSGLAENGKIPYMNKGLTETNDIEVDGEEVEMYKIHFDGFIAAAVGIFMLYILVLYCVDVGKRWVQLIYLQIISPIPIIGYLSPKKDGVFQKWCKQCLTTFLDLFIRIVLIYFILVICRILTNSSMFKNSGLDNNGGWVYVFLTLGLLMFAQNAPKLLQELFPSVGAASGNFGLKAGERFAPTLNAAKGVARGAGVATGLALGATLGAVHGTRQGLRGDFTAGKKAKNAALGFARGAFGGAARGLYNGGKKGNVVKNVGTGLKNQIASNKRFGAGVENDYGFKEQFQDRVGGLFGKSRTEKLDAQKAPRERAKAANEQIVKTNDAMREHALKKVYEKSDVTSANLRAMEGRVKALTEDPATKAKYKVGKYKTDDEAYDAYVNAVKDARASVNSRNYLNPDGTLNKDEYEKAMNREAAKVKQEDYQKGYATEAEAEAAYKADLGAAQAELKAAKDQAINNYIDTATEDAKLNRLKEERDSQIKDYNDYSSPEFAINTDNIYVYRDNSGKTKYSATENPTLGTLTGTTTISTLNAEAFDEYTKQVSQGEISRYSRELGSITAEQEAIKRQQDGTGVGGNK